MNDSLKLSVLKESIRKTYGVKTTFYDALSSKSGIVDETREAKESLIIESISNINEDNLSDTEKKEFKALKRFMAN